MDLLHRKAQSYKFSNKNDLFGAWRDFNKKFCGISLYHKWMVKLQISSIFHFDRAHQSWISGLLGVKWKTRLEVLRSKARNGNLKVNKHPQGPQILRVLNNLFLEAPLTQQANGELKNHEIWYFWSLNIGYHYFFGPF